MIESGLWSNVAGVSFGTITRDSRTGVTFTPSTTGVIFAFSVIGQSGDWINQSKTITDAGYVPMINLNHPELQNDYYPPDLGKNTDGIVIHLGELKKPSEDWIRAHFDSGGGSALSLEHLRDWWNRTGPSPDRVTGALGRTPAANHLRGISNSIDKLLVVPKP